MGLLLNGFSAIANSEEYDPYKDPNRTEYYLKYPTLDKVMKAINEAGKSVVYPLLDMIDDLITTDEQKAIRERNRNRYQDDTMQGFHQPTQS